MVPKLHAKGTSFKGLAAYLLHDKERAKTSDRVAWTEVRNLATHNPHVAWKVMAATAMDQARLKEAAGIKKTGRKSLDSVLHFTLSWHPDEKVDRAEVMRAVNGAIGALGAADRQALIVVHSDEPQAHAHILLNRVSSEDGRMLSSSKEKLELSKWAEKYEKDRGVVFCEERVLNNEARKRKQYTRGKKDQARNLYEEQQSKQLSQQVVAEQRKKDAELAKLSRETRARHRHKWAELQARQKEAFKDIRTEALLETAKRKNLLRDAARPAFRMLFQERQARMSDFLQKEKTVLGRVANALRAIDFQAIVRGQDTGPDGLTRRSAVKEAFNVLSSAGARKAAIERHYAKENRALVNKLKREEKDAAREVRENRNGRLAAARASFEKERSDLILGHKLEGAKVRADWDTRNRQRVEAFMHSDKQQERRTLSPKEAAELATARSVAESARQYQHTNKSKERGRGRGR